MVQIQPWETDSQITDQKIPHLLLNLKKKEEKKSLQLGHILLQFNLQYVMIPHLFKSHFNIIPTIIN